MELDALSPIVDLRIARSQAEAQAERFEREAPAAAPSVVRALRFVFEELGANIVQHSGAPATGFGSVAPARDGVELALADRIGRSALASADGAARSQGRDGPQRAGLSRRVRVLARAVDPCASDSRAVGLARDTRVTCREAPRAIVRRSVKRPAP